jgi:cell division protein FtsQ
VWNNSRLLHGIADTLFLGAVIFAVWLAAQTALGSSLIPLRAVTVTGALERVDADQLAAQIEGRLRGNLFGVDLDEARRAFEAAPWVRRATVRREWPDRLVAHVEEHTVLARWSDRRLVDIYGELFEGETDARLPRLGGPPGTEREVVRRYRTFRAVLAPLALEPVEVLLSARHAWQVTLANGLVLELGRDSGRQPPEERLARFVAAYPHAAAQLNRRLDYVDLRYPNGFAIRAAEAVEVKTTTKGPRTTKEAGTKGKPLASHRVAEARTNPSETVALASMRKP